MAGGTPIPRPQIGHEQLFATEQIERQETIVAIVTVKVRALLSAMRAIIGGVEVQDQLGGRRVERSHELVHQNPVQRPGGGAIGAVLQAAERVGLEASGLICSTAVCQTGSSRKVS